MRIGLRNFFSSWWAPAILFAFTIAHAAAIFLAQAELVSTQVSDNLLLVVGFFSTVMLFVTALSLRESQPTVFIAWLLIAFSQLATAGGDGLWTYYEAAGIDPYPSPADLLYLANYPLFLIAVLTLPYRKRTWMERAKTLIDISAIMLAALLGLWNLLLGPISLNNAGESTLARVLALAYPTGDLMLLGALLLIIYGGRERVYSRALVWLAAGIALTIVTDTVYGVQALMETYTSGSPTDIGFAFAYMCIGIAGWMQCRSYDTYISSPRNHPRWLSYFPYAWIVGAYGLLVVSGYRPLAMQIQEIILFVGLLIALVLARQWLALTENERLNKGLSFALDQLKHQSEMLEHTNTEMQKEIKERLLVEERLAYDAMHDTLTGLPNRALFLNRLEHAARKRKRNPAFQFAVLFLDLDSFKVINDSLGHTTGDQLLVQIARTLTECVRTTDTVARLGGDEFVILLEETAGAETALTTADRLQAVLRSPVDLNQTRVFVSVSIGVVMEMDQYERPEDILRDADLAMYQAKSLGKARYEIFHADMRNDVINRLEMDVEMRRALECHEFTTFYQPIFALPDRNLVGFEALVRWNHPTRGMLIPGEFVPLAEENGLIIPLGDWILHEACRQAMAWNQRFPTYPPLRVSVNISGKQVQEEDFAKKVANALEAHHLPGLSLVLEVTESICLNNMKPLIETFHALRKLGVEVQIDDFGTGYSSLSYLQQLPVGAIKIDRSFIHMPEHPGLASPEMVRAMISMAGALGMVTIAEGIENESELVDLSGMRCAYVQGYHLARPMDSASTEKWIFENRHLLQRYTSTAHRSAPRYIQANT